MKMHIYCYTLTRINISILNIVYSILVDSILGYFLMQLGMPHLFSKPLLILSLMLDQLAT